MPPASDAPARGPRPGLDLSDLNDRQRQAVLHAGSPLLILAGAGSGKTRVIATKVAHLIATGAVAPHDVLAVTFTNKAAAEMRSRIRGLVAASGRGAAGARVMVRTFHAFGAWLLRVHGARLGFEPQRLSIYDDGDVRQVLRGLLGRGYAASDLRAVAAWISTAKDRAVTADGDYSRLRRGPFQMQDIYPRYQARLATMNAADFGDLILLPVTLLRADRALCEELRQRFRVVLVDEFQDANRAQFELLRLLHGPHTYLCVVGDDDQSIYRFRGADLDGFLSFPKRFAGTEVIRLEQNYRSTGAILELASAVVRHNRRRMGKTLWTEQEQGALPVVTVVADQEQEARYCADAVRRLPGGPVAILYRMNFQSRTFETLFQSLRIPYRVVGTVRFYERAEVKDALAYLTLLLNPRDQVAFRRAVTRPRRGVGEKTVERVLDHAAAAAAGPEAGPGGEPVAVEAAGDGVGAGGGGRNLLTAAAQVAAAGGRRRGAGLARFVELMDGLAQAQAGSTVAELVRATLDRSGLYQQVLAEDQEERTGRVFNLEELVTAAGPYGAGSAGLASLLEDARLAGTEGSGADTGTGTGQSAAAGAPVAEPVTLITAHNTKGLEFDHVIVTGLEEGIFPAAEPGAPYAALPPAEEEEERRLFYVAVTRARFTLQLTACRRRAAFGFFREREPSRFLDEIPPECVRSAAAGTPPAAPDEPCALPVGQAVSHLDYGVGVISRRYRRAGQQVVDVQFQSGRGGTFIERYADLDRISNDE